MTPNFETVGKLTKDLKEASKVVSPTEARFLVDAYYTMQNDRIRSANQARAMSKSGEPCSVINYLFEQTETLEKQIAKALTAYAEANPVGNWAMSIIGIGGVLAAGLLAHIDIEKAVYAGNIWNFAGLNPNQKWEKGQKRPFNAKLKVICWKIGQSFVKVSNNPKDFYGKLYKRRKEIETAKNEAGEYAAQCRLKLVEKKYGKTTEAYKYMSGQYDPELNGVLKMNNLDSMTLGELQQFLIDDKKIEKLLKRDNGEELYNYFDQISRNFRGVEMLSPAHIQQRCERYATKIFLSHWQAVAYRYKFGRDAPMPFAISELGHNDYIEIPNNPFK